MGLTQSVFQIDKATYLLIMCSNGTNYKWQKTKTPPQFNQIQSIFIFTFILPQVLSQTIGFNRNHLRISPAVVTRAHLILVQLVTLAGISSFK